MQLIKPRQGESMQDAYRQQARATTGSPAKNMFDALYTLKLNPIDHKSQLAEIFNQHGLEKRMQPPERKEFVEKQQKKYSDYYDAQKGRR